MLHCAVSLAVATIDARGVGDFFPLPARLGCVAASRHKTNRHSRVRSDHRTETAEDYVEAIADTIEATGTCRAVDLVRQFQVSHVTVNRTIGRLERDGLVATKPYSPVHLTELGEQLAKSARKRHEVVYGFLVALGVSEKVAAADSEGIEHHVSPETLRAMKAFVDSRKAP
jgi:DtxR family manganese transport transcriptional regulator